MAGKVDCLSVSVATGICLFEVIANGPQRQALTVCQFTPAASPPRSRPNRFLDPQGDPSHDESKKNGADNGILEEKIGGRKAGRPTEMPESNH